MSRGGEGAFPHPSPPVDEVNIIGMMPFVHALTYSHIAITKEGDWWNYLYTPLHLLKQFPLNFFICSFVLQ